MHSRIFSVTTNKKKATEFDLPDWSLYEDMVGVRGSIVDYVSYSDDEDYDVEWFADVPGIDVDTKEKSFVVEDPYAYFKNKYEAFKKALSELSEITFTEFVNDRKRSRLYNLKTSYEDELSFYIYIIDDDSLISLDRFVRYHGDSSKRYYIGKTYDYHF